MKSIDDALNWARSIQQFAPMSIHHYQAVEELWPILAPLGVKNALEVGTGEPPGLIVQMLRKHGVEAYGLDGQPGSDYQGDMHELPFEDGSFDLVVARHSLEHVLIPYVALFEMVRVSRRWLLVVAPTDSEKALNWPDHLNVYSRGGWELMFRNADLTIKHFEVGDHTEQVARKTGEWIDLEYRWLLEKEA